MPQKLIDVLLVSFACCCMLSMNATSIFAQAKSKGKNKKESLVAGNDEKNKDLGDLVTNDLQTNDLLNTRESVFSVETPQWYEQPANAGEEELIFFRVFGFNQEKLNSEINLALRASAAAYLEEILGIHAAQYVYFSDQDLRSLINTEEIKQGTYFDGTQSHSVQFFFASVKFNEQFQDKAERMWIEKRQKNRLFQHGLFAGITLLLIGLTFAGLKLNSATSGFYQGRLQFFVAIVILGVIAAGVYFGFHVAWI